mgnify:CR=1 FL=1
MDKIKIIEKEWRRIDTIVSKPLFNPLDIFQLSGQFTRNELRKSYYKISRLIHPDKSWNNNRFCRVFTIVNDNYRLLLNDPKVKRIYIKAQKLQQKRNPKKKDLIRKLFATNTSANRKLKNKVDMSKNNGVSPDLRLVLWKPLEIIKYANNIQKDKVKITSKIAMRGAEHRTKKSKSKRDKHQKGLKQRVTQRKNAEKRIVNHQFSFTDHISLEYLYKA